MTLSNSDTFQFRHFPIQTLSNSDTFQFRHFPIETLSNSDTFQFWPFPILTLSGLSRIYAKFPLYRTSSFYIRLDQRPSIIGIRIALSLIVKKKITNRILNLT